MWSLQASLHLPGVAPLRSGKTPEKNLDNGSAIAGGGAAILGVGHFTVPPDAIVQAPTGLQSINDVAGPSSTIRTIVVPHGISAVPRRSPIKARKRTPWHPAPEAQGMVARGGSREWLTDRLFVESKQTHMEAAWTTSVMVHVALVILVLLLLGARAARPDTMPRSRMDVSLRMPAILLLPAPVTPPTLRTSVENPLPAPKPRPALPVGPASQGQTAAPTEAPASIEAEPATLDDTNSNGTAIGAETGGVAGGTGGGSSIEAAAPEASGPYRLGEGIARPRKIKDVKPVYPQAAMTKQLGGSVVIEATIGADGKVHNARVLRSIDALDQAALDAVGQWEFEPTRLNGVAVAVIMVVVVTFSLL